MSNYTIYHNPRCSKSRNTLSLLNEKGVEPEIVLYLENPPTASDIKKLLKKLGITADALVRRGEDDYKKAGLSKTSTEAEIVSAMAEYPKLIERPIVIKGNKAVLGRPPENVLGLL